MTKEEKIREAWINTIGEENYNSVLKNGEFKDYGWRKVKSIPMFTEDVYDVLKYSKIMFSIRPKSLQGIENNNGWIKIESEEDLPEQGGSYYVTRCDKVETAVYVKDNRWLVKGNDYPKTTILHSITHYQPIQKPQPPIY
jgi:hypothetical protein